ncbi:unnamed protein product, partial [Symbiodinium pilosum]
ARPTVSQTRLGPSFWASVSRREDLQKALDNMTSDDPARENTEAELQELGAVIKSLKKGRRPRDGAQRLGTAADERDKPEMGGRLERTEKNLHTQLTWARRFDQPGAGNKEKVFPLAEKELKDEKAAAPLSRHARSALLEEDPQEELPEPKARTRELPPSETKVTAAKKAKKHREERKREKSRKAEKAEKARGRPRWAASLPSVATPRPARKEPPTGALGGLGASATTLPRKLLGESSKLKEPVGYRSFRLADGSVVANEGTLKAKAWSPRSPSHSSQWA